MCNNFHRNIKTLRLSAMTLGLLSLMACEDAAEQKTQLAGVDVVSPKIVSTVPSAGKVDVNPNANISIKFSEQILKVSIEQLTIHPVVAGVIDHPSQVILFNDRSFVFDALTNTLMVNLQQGDLVNNKHYRVIVRDIFDSVGNRMIGDCQWDFTTPGSMAVTIATTIECTVQSALSIPNEPQNINATAGDRQVTVVWQAAFTGSTTNYYKIEKSIDNQQSFTTVQEKVLAPNLFFTDITATNEISHIYRVTAGNSAGLGGSAISMAVTPNIPLITSFPATPLN